MFGMFGAALGGGTFDANYRCYPVSFLDKPEAEGGDKVFLPPSALDRLASLHIEYPMLFRLENRKDGRTTHCGVLEFIAEEGMIYMPYWMMQNMLLTEGGLINVKSASLPKGRYVKLQPHTKDFLDISNPKAVLETTLRNFSCLTVGDCIVLHYNNKKYYVDIVDAKPGNAISIIETDCEVDFAPPLDYVEPNRDEGPAAAPAEAMATDAAAPAEEVPPEEPKFSAFTGSGRRLDGKPATAGTASSSAAGPAAAALARSGAASGASAAGPSGRPAAPAANGAATAKGKVAGKVMFQNRLLQKQAELSGAAAPKPPTPPKPEPTEEESKFKAFQGKANRLK